jgi:hypothetical protein
MRFYRFPALVMGLIVVVLPGHDAVAWGDEGHKVVAVIAYAHLKPAVKKKVDALLAADKDKLSARDFVSRATWADKYRDSDRFSKKIRYSATHNWHFVDIEIDSPNFDAACFNHPPLPAGTAASAGPANDCVVDKINEFAAELRNPATPQPEKILALKFLEHFVGDLHQPLHAADHKDRGGNQVPVLFAKRTVSSNLHSYWDTELVKRLGKEAKTVGVSLNKQIATAKANEWSKGTPADWAKESFDKAKSVAYNFSGEQDFIDDHGGKGERLDATYDNRGLPVVREQLSKGGVRLAAVLNDALK